VFDDEYEVDEKTIAEQRTDISNHKDVFKAVYSKVRYLLTYVSIYVLCVGSWYSKCPVIIADTKSFEIIRCRRYGE